MSDKRPADGVPVPDNPFELGGARNTDGWRHTPSINNPDGAPRGPRATKAAPPPRAAGTRAPVVPAGAPARAGAGIDVTTLDLTGLSQKELGALARLVHDEEHRRALLVEDLDAVVEEGFAIGFDRRGVPLAPMVVGSLVVVFGGIIAKSESSHTCRFISIDGAWVWEHPDVMADVVRTVGSFDKRSVTLLPLMEGMTFEVVTSKMSMGRHKMTSVDTWTVVGSDLVKSGGRRSAPAPVDR